MDGERGGVVGRPAELPDRSIGVLETELSFVTRRWTAACCTDCTTE